MAERHITISNKLGLHARAAAKLVQLSARYQSMIQLRCKGKTVNAKSILGVMMLAAGKGTELILMADGGDADQALDAAVDLFNRKFDEGE
jgi:phosphocarrier protein HPr